MSRKNPESPDRSRRSFLRGAALAVPGLMLLSPWERLLASTPERSLSFYHTHTGEKLSLVYHADGDYVPESLAQIDQFLRDFRTDEVHAIDTGLLDLLHQVHDATGGTSTFEVISGYRSPATNSMLRGKSNGVAKRSLHMQGRAIDVRLNGIDTRAVRAAALDLKQGGVGYYSKSNFVHLDTGRFRTW